MGERKDIVRRLTAVLLAVAMGVGAVMLMRVVAQEIAGANGPVQGHVRRATVETGANAPRVYDLGTLITGDLRYSVLGQTGRRQDTEMLSPFTLTLRTTDAQAKADGWMPFKSPDPKVARYMRMVSNYMYEKPDGRLVCRRFYSVTSERTRVVEIELPGLKEYCDSFDPAALKALPKDSPELDLYGFIEPKARQLRMKLPRVLEEVIVGLPTTSALVTRAPGHVFEIITLERGSIPAVEKRVCALLLAHGWFQVPNGPGLYQKKNLTFCFRCTTEVEMPYTVVTSYRISDDEVRINQQGANNEI